MPAGILVLPTLDKRLYTSNALVMMPTPDFSMVRAVLSIVFRVSDASAAVQCHHLDEHGARSLLRQRLQHAHP